MDALDVAVLALRLGLVALLYAFLAVVLRAAARLGTAEPLPAGDASGEPGRISAAGPTSLTLVVVQGGATTLEPGARLTVRGSATLGRAGDAAIVLADPTVSGRHAAVAPAGHGWVVEDLDSTNGTFVNESAVRGAMALAPGDRLRLGGVVFAVA